MLELREFDLKFTFARAGALRKDVEDQRRAVEDLDLEDFFQVARLRGGKFIVEDDRVHRVLFAIRGELDGLALADIGGGIARLDFLRALADDFAARAPGQFGQLIERLAQLMRAAGFQFDAHEEDPFRPCISGLD